MKKQSGLLRRLTALALALCMLAALTTEIFAVKNATYSTSAGTKSTNIGWNTYCIRQAEQ